MRRSLTANSQQLNFSDEPREQNSVVNASTEENFSTAAELFDAHPESLEDIFDSELEAGLTGSF